MKRTPTAITACLFIAAMAAGTASASPVDEPRRADVALVAAPSAVEFPAQGGNGQVRLNYYNPGNVTKEGATISAEIPAGLTVRATAAPGWQCHIDEWPALICNTATALAPGQSTYPVEVELRADAPLTTRIEFGTLGFYRDPTENPADNYSTVTVTAG
ncbi:hypothetical protein [Amycolatopsis nigrescens]|uniref:hypothetical protein n=1 Tax=Amycolatopsis nigrescens TaxID=381445 RepID=UPI00036F913E|nr:hypothetical protein [Amycolatopsis nigrescens]